MQMDSDIYGVPAFEPLIDRGNVFMSGGDYDSAIDCYNAALDIDPINTTILSCRGVAYAEKGDYDNAIADYNAVLEIDPVNTETQNLRGRTYAMKGDYKSALACYDAALEYSPNNEAILGCRGIVYAIMNDYDNAIANYSAALEITYDHVLYFFRGVAYLNKKNYNSAIADFSAVLEINPDDAKTLYCRGLAYYHNHNYDNAIADYERVLQIKPNWTKATKGLYKAKKKKRGKLVCNNGWIGGGTRLFFSVMAAAVFFTSGLAASAERDSRLVTAEGEAWVSCEIDNNTEECDGIIFRANGEIYTLLKMGKGVWVRWIKAIWSTNGGKIMTYSDETMTDGDDDFYTVYTISGPNNNTLTLTAVVGGEELTELTMTFQRKEGVRIGGM
ncbi:MAG: tetratricopeptide repeat protein [Chitinispirillales bacterium]|jgi:tetratricopeptide (TPR) repeat protein|nr:tetratricopeptide repeat protein [Chitinispirillales bacterium]